ncbi:hypothetical protein OOZ15_14665 [Galbibacter sp. EGI 63066]|uniref:hypothetical protein n=1 Tax=Galbibacter sp. EGI 63066 TaxID=2993559 RepID=UPI0022490A9D|nr:hypothetical protein [Galbibacter sp. EGI 63066]MCX2681192.1 hypothetical protein [Galbibacter sp. EGI 63066]
MKRIFNTIIGTVIILGFSQCGSSQGLTENPPFELGEVRSEPWTAGAEKEQEGENIFLPVSNGKEIVLDSLFYKGKVVKLEKIQRDNYLVYIGRFSKADTKYDDLIMHADPKEEFGNKPPKLNKKIPFELKEGEAVVSYIEDGKTKYYKVKSMRPATPVHYEKAPTSKN